MARASVVRRRTGRRSIAFFVAVVAAALLFSGPAFAPRALGADPSGAPTTQPASPPTSDRASPTPDQQRIENVIAAARQYLGVAYRVGSEGPRLFDCSGLVFRAFSDAGLVDRIGGARLRAAGYMRWFASRGQMTSDESQALRGDLVIYDHGSHIGVYLGDGRVVSALLSGVTAHSLHGVDLPVTGFLRPNWAGDGAVPPFVPAVDVPEEPEAPATLVPASSWMPTLDPALIAPPAREGKERIDLRTVNTRTFLNRDGTFTTEFHAQPIFYQPEGTTNPAQLRPIDLHFITDPATSYPLVSTSPVTVTTHAANDPLGFVSAVAGNLSVSLGIADAGAMSGSEAAPQLAEAGRAVDFFAFQPQRVGLRVLARTDGFKSFLVLAKEPANNRFRFTLDAPGLTPVMQPDGSVALVNASGDVAGRIPRPLLLDSSDEGEGGGLYTAATSLNVDTTGAQPILSVNVNRSHLDEAAYPAYLDLSLSVFPAPAAGADIAFASSSHPNAALDGLQRPESAGFDDLWLGRQPGTRNDNEVFVRFADLEELLGTVDVASAQLEILPYIQVAHDGVTIARTATSDWAADTLTWATRPATDATDLGTFQSSATAWSTVDVSDYLANVLSRGQRDFGLVLAGDETSRSTWKRFAASDAGATAEFGPRLVVTWSGLRPTAVDQPATTEPAGGKNPPIRDAPPPWAEPASRIVSWLQPGMANIGGGQTRYQVQVSHDDFATVDADSGTVKGRDGKRSSWTVPQDALRVTATYQWQVRVKYGTDKSWSPWSAAQAFEFISTAQTLVAPHGATI